MQDLGNHLLTAFAFVFVIEGLLYAVFPDHVQRMMAAASDFPKEKFRYFGATMLAFGVILVWIFQKL